MIFTLKHESIEKINETEKTIFPKYTSQLINLANQNAQGTRPNVIGQLSELFPEFLCSDEEKNLQGWSEWYKHRYPLAIENATKKIYNQIVNLQNAIAMINEPMVRQWVEDLVMCKTFNGLYIQKAILASLSEMKGEAFRLATPDEEARGIDGYVGHTAYSVKPSTYKTMGRLSECIDMKMIYYTKKKTGFEIEVEE